ncbi:RHS repeat-associated core domain-containing protein [Baekduia sp. Peel2402]|uniref:RHS repeat-associated core domain-containing protein n=1 Tax=Baekduia sp. Peel2402 TaxID=3458296 RepID=UPI00403EB36D
MSALRSRFVLLVALLGSVAALLVALVVGTSSEADSGQAATTAAAPQLDFEGPASGTEIPELRTESSRTYRKADGRYQAQIWASPVNYRDAEGKWKPIDTDLEPDGSGGLKTTEATAKVALPESLADPATVTAGGRWVSFALDGADADAAPTADGAIATYPDVLDGVDAEYEAQPLGLKETLTLADVSAPSSYTYTLDASQGLTPELRDDGAVAFRDGDGKVRFWLPTPTVQAHGDTAPSSEHVAYRLSEDRQTLTVAVDPEWLEQAEFPVEVDPSIWFGDDISCTLSSATPTTQACGGTTLKVGRTASPAATYRAALRFPDFASAIPRTASVMGAELGLWFQSQSGTDSSTPVTVTGSGKLLGSVATWNTYNGSTAWTTAGGDFATDPQPALTTLYSSWTGGWVNFNLGRLAERWLRSPSTNNGILVKAQNETGLNNVLTFDGHQAAHGGPTIRVDFEWHPGFESDQTYESLGFDGNSKLAVNVATGNVAVDSTDINLPGAGGFNLKLRRTFNGQNLGNGAGVFGSGWSEGINNAAFLGERVWYDDSRTIYGNGNAIYRFDRDWANDTSTTRAYLSPPNINADLVTNKSTGVATLTFRDTGVKWTYAASYDGYTVQLAQVSDAAGHHIDITPKSGRPERVGSITDSNGDVLNFTYGTNGQLLKIAKGTTEWNYGTTIVNGHNLLTSYTSPSSQTTSYHYDATALPGTWDKLDKVTSRDNIIFNLVYGPQGDWSQVTQITQDFPDSRPDSVSNFNYKPSSGTGHACASPVSNSPWPNNVVFDRTVATDPAGHVTTYCYNTSAQVIQTWRPWDTTVRNTRIGLEKFWDYDSVDTGAGSQLLVNAETGNLLWHHVPVVNPGRGLSTFVNVDYNSLEGPPRLGEQQDLDPLGPVGLNDPVAYNTAGRGISLGVSGPTRLNEPLSGVGLADVRDGKLTGGVPSGLPAAIGADITLTDADGTRHHFTRDATNTQKWNAPPGVHLTLRRFAYTGDGLTQPYWVMTRPDGVAHFFNQLGYLIRTEDRNGNTLTYTYEKYDLLTGQSGTSAASCTLAQMLGAVSGTPSSSNAWGLRTTLGQSVSGSAAGRVCTLRATKVTDAGGRDLLLAYTPRVAADQTRLSNRLSTVLGGGSVTLQSLLTSAASTLTDLGKLMGPTPLAKVTDHAGREYTFGYDANRQLTDFVEVANADALAPTGDHSRRWGFEYLPGEDPTAPMRLQNVVEHRDNGEADRRTTVGYQTHPGTPAGGEVPALVPDTITDRRGKDTTYAFTDYGAPDRTMTVTDARGKAWKHRTDAYGRPVEIIDPNTVSTTLDWDTDPAVTVRQNDLTRVAEGVVKNGSGTITDQGAPVRMTYDAMSGLLKTQTTYPDGDDTTAHAGTGRTTTLTYTLSNGKTSLRPSSDPNTNFVADLTGIENPRTAPGSSAKVGWTFDVSTDSGNVNWRQDRVGGPKSYTDYCTSADGATCPVGQVKAETDEVGNVTTYNDYDASGMPQTVIDPKGNPQSTRDTGYPTPPNPNTATASAHRWRYRYDTVGNVLAQVDPRNTQTTPDNTYTTRLTYDAFDRVIQKISPKKSASSQYVTETYTYDRNDNLVGESNPGTGRILAAAFSATDQPLTVTETGWSRNSSDPRGNTYTTRPEVTTFSYDETDLLVSRTDPRGASGVPASGGSPNLPYTTEWTRDPAGRVVAETRHATSAIHVQALALDPRGNVVGQVDAARNANPDGNVNTNDAYTPQAAADAAAAAIATNQLSKLRVSMAYDRVDELTSQTERPSPSETTTATPRTNKYTYDADGNVVKHVLPRDDHDVPAGFTSGAENVATTYTYDHRDQLLTTVDPTGATTAVKRRADGKVIAQTTPRGVVNGTTESDGSYKYFTSRYSYDQAGDLLTRTVPYAPNQYGRAGTANNDYLSWKVSYMRDAVGNPTTIVDGRNKSITNTFLDTGALESTSRPSWWQLSWGGASTGAPDPGRRFTDQASSEPVPVNGPQLAERDTPLTGADTSSEQPSSTAQGKFGAVTPAEQPSWMPRSGAALFAYDDDGRLTSVTDAALSISRIDYDPTGRIVGTTQPLGANPGATLTSGDPTPCAKTSSSCAGVIAHRYDYDLNGNVTKTELLGDTSWHSDLTYDSFDRVVNRTDPGASDVPADWATPNEQRQETQYTYDTNDNLIKRVTPNGTRGSTAEDYEYKYDYDTLDRLILERDPENDYWGYAWDVDDNLVRELTPNGRGKSNEDDFKTYRTYDANDRLVNEQGPVVAGGGRNTTTLSYFPDGALAFRTDPGSKAEATGPDNVARLTGYDYDGRGLRSRVTEGHLASGAGFDTAGDGPRTTLTEYDANSNLRRVVDPSGVTMTGTGVSQAWAPTNPDVIGDNLTSTASADAVHATVYDYSERTDADDGSNVTNGAGESGEPTAIYQPRSGAGSTNKVLAQRMDYDPLGRVRSIWTVDDVNGTSPWSVHTSYERLSNGWIGTAKDYATKSSQSSISNYNYDQSGNQLSWKLDPVPSDPNNNISTIEREYWSNGQMKRRTGYAAPASTTPATPRQYSYWYDGDEALTGVRDPLHQRMVYVDHDTADRTTSVVQRYGTGTTQDDGQSDPNEAWRRGRDSTFSYDNNGNVTARRVNGTFNRVTKVMSDPVSGSPHSTTRFTYDNEDKETIAAFYEPTKLSGSPTITDSTCAQGAPTPPAGVRCVRTTYHPSGERRSRRQQNDTLVTTYFDDHGQPTKRVRTPSGGLDVVTSYTYDLRGNRLSDTPGVGTYTYNARNQLTSWKRGSDFNTTGNNRQDWTVDYTRNPDGTINQTTERQSAASGGALVRTKDYTYTGQRLDYTRSTPAAGGNPAWDLYDYNQYGSLVGLRSDVTAATKPAFTAPVETKDNGCSSGLPTAASDTTLYCLDEFDRVMRQRSGASDQQRFDYDGMDRRDSRTDHAGGTNERSGFKYVGTTSTISGQQVPTGATTSSLVSFDRDSANRPLAVTLQASGSTTQVTKTYATDANGNPTGLEEANGSVPAPTNRYVFDPYGDLDSIANSGVSGDAATNPLRFNGFDYDAGVKTYDMQVRDYRPSAGRFLQTDRYESAQSDLSLIADPLTQNRYDFAGSDPVNNVEFDGHIPGAGSGCQPRCGDNFGNNISTDKKGNSTNANTSAASGTSKPTKLNNPAAKQVVASNTPSAKAAQKQLYREAKTAAVGALSLPCAERCSDEQREKNVNLLAGAYALGLDPRSLQFDMRDHKGIDAVDDVWDAASVIDGAFLVRGAVKFAASRLALRTAEREAAVPLFTQGNASLRFQRGGPFGGRTIGDVASGLRSGAIKPSELPVDVIKRRGELLAVNTRSTLALRRAGIEPSRWTIRDMTGNEAVENQITRRLARNEMSKGSDVIRISGDDVTPGSKDWSVTK